MIQKNYLTPDQAFQKLKHFCGYQERTHQEVKDKLYSLGLWKKDVETTLSRLIEEDYLNEERFAKAFAGGKFRMKQWGRVKIIYEMKQKGISAYCMKIGLREIEQDEYEKTLRKLAEKKRATLSGEKNGFIKKRKLMDYLLQKGYERDLCLTVINEQTRSE
ncbi:MAG TPA: regulatory protein RecX [Flavitalea sp.]|nr:regulatory protein RecX [Flavitalea sp.]